MIYIVNVSDIENALANLGGEAKSKDIQDKVLNKYCEGNIPSNYRSERSFRQTIQRKIEDYCPQAEGFDPAKKESKFVRVGHGLYRTSSQTSIDEFPAIEEVSMPQDLFEGALREISVNAYERNQTARKNCIDHYGWSCIVCGFDFEKAYGEIGKSFIHVHHIKPLSEIRSGYIVNPILDLRPVCANCHAIIHRVYPPLSTEELKAKIFDTMK